MTSSRTPFFVRSFTKFKLVSSRIAALRIIQYTKSWLEDLTPFTLLLRSTASSVLLNSNSSKNKGQDIHSATRCSCTSACESWWRRLLRKEMTKSSWCTWRKFTAGSYSSFQRSLWSPGQKLSRKLRASTKWQTYCLAICAKLCVTKLSPHW